MSQSPLQSRYWLLLSAGTMIKLSMPSWGRERSSSKWSLGSTAQAQRHIDSFLSHEQPSQLPFRLGLQAISQPSFDALGSRTHFDILDSFYAARDALRMLFGEPSMHYRTYEPLAIFAQFSTPYGLVALHASSVPQTPCRVVVHREHSLSTQP